MTSTETTGTRFTGTRFTGRSYVGDIESEYDEFDLDAETEVVPGREPWLEPSW